MKTKRYISGIDNNQKIRVIINGIGFVTTVKGVFDMCIAVSSVLTSLGFDQYLPEGRRPTGLLRREKVFSENGETVEYDVQVDLL
jgi:hypothetical protein